MGLLSAGASLPTFIQAIDVSRQCPHHCMRSGCLSTSSGEILRCWDTVTGLARNSISVLSTSLSKIDKMADLISAGHVSQQPQTPPSVSPTPGGL